MNELAVSSGEGGDEDSLPTRWQERKRWWKVYALYFVFMWTSNIYEYASVSSPYPIETCINGEN
jgi:iron-regulated transporter 1